MMHPSMLRAFRHELEKQAVSAATTLSFLQQRAAQGARVAPALMRKAESAAAYGLGHTPSVLRRTALGAGEAARAAQGAEQLAARSGVGAQRAAFQTRANQMTEAIHSAPQTVTSPILGGKSMYRGYSPGAADFMVGRGTLAQAQAHTMANQGFFHQARPMPTSGRLPSPNHATPPMGASAAGIDPYGRTVIDAAAKTQVGTKGVVSPAGTQVTAVTPARMRAA